MKSPRYSKNMQIKKLIAELQKLDGDLEVVLSSDEEGNSFSKLAEITGPMVYNNRETGFEKLTAGLVKAGYTEDDMMTGEKCVVLYPTD